MLTNGDSVLIAVCYFHICPHFIQFYQYTIPWNVKGHLFIGANFLIFSCDIITNINYHNKLINCATATGPIIQVNYYLFEFTQGEASIPTDCSKWYHTCAPVCYAHVVTHCTYSHNTIAHFKLYMYYTWVRASWIESNNCPTRCDLFSLLHFCRQLYTFRVLTPIIRSLYN